VIEEAATSLEGDYAKASEHQRAAAASAGTMGDFSVGTGLEADEQAAFELRKFFAEELKAFSRVPEFAGERRCAKGHRPRRRFGSSEFWCRPVWNRRWKTWKTLRRNPATGHAKPPAQGAAPVAFRACAVVLHIIVAGGHPRGGGLAVLKRAD